MKIIQISQTGPAEVLQCIEVERPAPGPGELLVRAHSIGVGMPDVMIRAGIYMWMPPLPAIPGIEMSGVVAEVGAGVEGFQTGQAVIVSARERPHRGGCYAQYMLARPNEVFALPPGTDMEGAAALANYQVAWHLLHSASRVRAGETVLIYAAAGGVGSAAVQLAALAQLRVIAVVSNAEKATFARQCGAAEVIDRSSGEVGARLLEITAGRGADLILDPVGGPEFTRNVALLAPLGLLVAYGGLAGRPKGDLLAAMNARFGMSPAVRRFSMHCFDQDPPRRVAATRELITLLAGGKIRPKIYRRLRLEEAAEAHRILEGGPVIGKLLLQP